MSVEVPEIILKKRTVVASFRNRVFLPYSIRLSLFPIKHYLMFRDLCRNLVLNTATYLSPTFAKQIFDMVHFKVDHEAPSTVLAYYKIIYGYGSTSASHTVTKKQVKRIFYEIQYAVSLKVEIT